MAYCRSLSFHDPLYIIRFALPGDGNQGEVLRVIGVEGESIP